MVPRALLALVLTCAIACGADAPTPAPTSPTPTPPVPAPNQAPEIVSATVSPSFGIWGVTAVMAHVEARDPDGDPLSIEWSGPAPGGTRVWGTTVDLPFTAGDIPGMLKVTVTDRAGARVSKDAPFRMASLSEHFDGYFGDVYTGFDFRMSLKQTGTMVTGTFVDLRSGDRRTAVIDEARPGQIDADGRFSIPFTLGSVEFTIVGQVEPSLAFGGFSAIGKVFGGPFSGRRFTASPHDSF